MTLELSVEECLEIMMATNPPVFDTLDRITKMTAAVGVMQITTAMETLGYRISRPLKSVTPEPAA